MASVFAGLPNDIIISIVKIENRRSIIEENNKKYNMVIKEFHNKLNNFLWFACWKRNMMGRGEADGLQLNYHRNELWGGSCKCPYSEVIDIAIDFLEEVACDTDSGKGYIESLLMYVCNEM